MCKHQNQWHLCQRPWKFLLNKVPSDINVNLTAEVVSPIRWSVYRVRCNNNPKSIIELQDALNNFDSPTFLEVNQNRLLAATFLGSAKRFLKINYNNNSSKMMVTYSLIVFGGNDRRPQRYLWNAWMYAFLPTLSTKLVIRFWIVVWQRK